MFKETRWFRNVNVRKRKIAGKNLLINIKSNRLLILNEQAGAIWDQLSNSGPRKESDIIKALQYKYNSIPTKKLQKDAHNFLTELQNKKFVYQDSKFLSQPIFFDKKLNILGHFSFSENFHQIAAKRNIPISAGFEITQRCNLKCLHCYINNQPVNYNKEFTIKDIYNLLKEMAKNGCLWLLITGGEPLLRKDFCEIYRYAKKLGMIITVFTNATKITEKIADLFIKYPPFLIEATLHGSTRTTFDTITGVSGSFDQFQRGIQFLRERQIPFHLKMIVMRQNVYEVEAARQLAIEMGADDFRFDPMINADFFHSNKIKKLRVTIKNAAELDLHGSFKNRWKKIYRTALIKKTNQQTSGKLLFPCRAGKCSFTISANGHLLPCILMRFPTYDLQKLSFMEAWKKLNHYVITTYMRKNNSCLKCSLQACSKCPAWGYLEYGDPNSKSSYACALQHEREKNFLGSPK